MRLIKYEYLLKEELYEFTYDHKHRGVHQELVFRHPNKETGYSVYTTWLKEGNTSADEHITKQWKDMLEKAKEFPEDPNNDNKG